MLSCHKKPNTKLNYVTSTLIILTMAWATGQGARLKRDAGFYTTRFGRSDPMMRFQEVQTRFVPEPGTGQGHSQHWNPQFSDMDNEATKSSVFPPLACIFSVRRKAYVCL